MNDAQCIDDEDSEPGGFPDDIRPIDGDYIDRVFGPSGFLAQKFAGYEPRAAQIEVVRAIDEALTNEKNLLVEAGTGTGKSLGYLVPAIRHALESGASRVLVVTANNALSEQLIKKDLPTLRDVLPWQFEFALAKGRSNYACFAGETAVITRDGVFQIRDLAGQTAKILDGDGHWVDAPIKSFGVQKLMRVNVTRKGAKMSIYATPNHRWLVRRFETNDDLVTFDSSTKDLKPGQRLPCSFSHPIAGCLRPSPIGIAHGIVFGDGSMFAPTIGGWRTANVVLHGEKKELTKYFPLFEIREFELDGSYSERTALRVTDLPTFFKRVPSLDEAPSYLYGWLAGYFATDGSCSAHNGQPMLWSAKRENLEFVRAVCLRLGIPTGQISKTSRIGIGQTEASDLFSLSLMRAALPKEFFLREKHAIRAIRADRPNRFRPHRESWLVESVEMTDREEEVFCAEVSTTQSFTLGGYLLTGNCKWQFDHADRTLLRVLPSSREQLERIDEWAARTTTGDLSELPFEPSPEMKRRLTVQSDECMGRKCDRFDSCFVEAAKRRLETAKVVVTNYHLFFADRMIRRLTDDESGVLPNVDIVIFDEADRAPSISRSFYGFELSRGQIVDASRLLVGDRKEEIPEIDQDLKIRIEELSKTFFDELAAHAKSKEYKARFREQDAVSWRVLEEAIKEMARKYSVAAGNVDLDKSRKEKLRKKSLKCYKLASDLREAMELANENFAYFVKVDEKNRATLCGSPIDVAELLERDVWKNEEYRSVVGTSATLTTDGDFDWIKDELGAHEAEELAVDSPFDVRSNMLVVVPEGIPLPNEKDFQDEASRILCDAIDLARGRTLGLFTSHRGLKSAAYFVNQRHGRKYEILVQGTAPRTQLVQRKRDVPSSVLLGTESFWTGVDVQGEALSLLFIDKLPFPTPDDPILDVLAERDPKGHWMKNCLPRALIAFKQGIGRLLRTTTDRGVVVICDSRIVDKPYGRTFLKACGGARVSRNLHDVGSFLDEPEKWKREVKTKVKKMQPKETIRVPRGARVR